MRSRITRTIMVGLLSVATALITGCNSKTVVRSTITTAVGDRQVKATLDGGAFVSTQGDTAVVSFSGGELLIKKGSVELNGKELEKLPEGAKKIEVDYTAGKLTVVADDKEVLSTELQK